METQTRPYKELADITADDLTVLGGKLGDINTLAKEYAERGSLCLPLLWLTQRQEGWVSDEAKADIALLTGKNLTEVQEVVTFYTMYFQKPVGKYVIGVCMTLPCALCAAGGLFDYLSEKFGIKNGETTDDGKFTLIKYECLGACSEAPLMLVNEKLHIKLSQAKVDLILAGLE